MTIETTRELCHMELDFVRADNFLEEIRDALRRAARESQECREAAGELLQIRRRLRRVLLTLDPLITAAVAQHETTDAPF